MSIGQTFPDVLILPTAQIRVVTIWAEGWLHNNQGWLKEIISIDYEAIPKIINVPSNELTRIVNDMDMDGLTVRWKRTRY